MVTVADVNNELVGKQAPYFEALDQNGANVKLSNFVGEKVLLYFYPKDFTPGCTKEACAFRDLFFKLGGKIVVLGVSNDSVDSHKKFCEKYNLPFTLLSDPAEKIIARYNAKRLLAVKRVSYLINEAGIVEKFYDKVNPETHALEVAKDIGIDISDWK